MAEEDSRKRTVVYGSPQRPSEASDRGPEDGATRVLGSSPLDHEATPIHEGAWPSAPPHGTPPGEPERSPRFEGSEGWDPENDGFPLLTLEEPARLAEKRELLELVAQALSRFAITGSPELEGYTLVLDSPRGQVRQDARAEIIRWHSMETQMRDRAGAQLARKLAVQIQASQPPTARRQLSIDGNTLLLSSVALAVMAAAIYLGAAPGSFDGSRAPAAPAAPAAVEQVPQTLSRAESVCQATRARVLRGGLISMADAEGWVVEMAFLGAPDSPPFESRAPMAEFFGPIEDGSADYIWDAEPRLAVSSHAEPRVQLIPFSIANEKASRPGLRIAFEGSFVESYFDELSRPRFFHLASELVERLHPRYAALYAHCTQDQFNTLGSWFAGTNAGGAATALVYFLGMYASPRHIDPLHFRSPSDPAIDHDLAISNIAQATKNIDRAALSTLVGSEGGMALGGPDSGVVISFPFPDGNRASRVSRTVARVAGLAQ